MNERTERVMLELTTAKEMHEHWRTTVGASTVIASWNLLSEIYRIPWYGLAELHIKMVALEHRLEQAEKQLGLEPAAQGENDA